MKKFMKNLTKALCLLFVVTFATFSFIGCKNNNNNSNQADNTASSTIGTETGGVAENVTQGEEPTETPEEVLSLNGIYKMARPVTYKDTMWEVSNEEVFSFFETTDINGVYNALRKLGAIDYVNANTVEIDGTIYEMVLGFIEDNFHGILYDGYTYKIETTISTSLISNKIEIIDEKNIIVHYQFIYPGENSEPIQTPVFIKVPFEKISHSENVLSGITYSYEAGSAKINLTNQSTMTEEKALTIAADILGIPTENVDIAATIELMFTRYNVQLDELLSKATLFDVEEGSFTFAPITNATGFVDGISITIVDRYINISTGIETVNFEIVLDDSAKLIFTYQAV